MLTTSTNPRLTDDLVDRLVQIWVDVTNDGGAVGFVGPVTAEQVSNAVAGFWDRVIDGVTDLVVVEEDGTALGFGFLTPAADPDVAAHRAEVQKVQRHPDARGRGIGAAVLAGLEARAHDRGIRLLTLTVRGGTGRESFYTAHGYALVATLPGWLEIDGRATDSLVLAKHLQDRRQDGRSRAVPAVAPGTPAAPVPAVAPGTSSGVPGMTEPTTGARMQTAPGDRIPLKVRRLDPDLPLPAYARPGDAGLDLLARRDQVLPPGTRSVMPTGLAVAIPEGWVGLIHPRSGLAVSQGLSIVNTPGTIDAGYRGELMVPLINLDPSATIRIARGDRIAQLLLQRVAQADLEEVDVLPDGVRGADGFGSTGR